jgi:hypothetical protein
MPNYRITSPDGRTITISGTTPPTDNDLDDIFVNLPPQPESVYGTKNVAAARAAVIKKAQEQDDNRSIGEVIRNSVANFFGKNPVGHAVAAALQGVNKGNPFVQAASLIPGADTINDNVITPGSNLEKALETAAEFITPAGIMAKGIGLAAKGIKGTNRLSRFGKKLLTPAAMPIEYAGAAGAGALTGATDPDTFAGKLTAGLVGGLAGGTVAGLANAFGPGHIKNFIGRSSLRHELDNAINSSAVSDVNFTKISDKQLSGINNIRDLEQVARIENGNITIPSGVIKHIADRRIINDGVSSKKITDAINDVLYKKTSYSSPTKNPNIQALIDIMSRPANISFISKHTGNNGVVLKTARQQNSGELQRNFPTIKDILGGRADSTIPEQSITNAGAAALSDFQNIGILNQKSQNVKKNLSDKIFGTAEERALKQLERNVGGRKRLEELLADSKKSGLPLIDLGNDNITNIARAAATISPNANEIISDRLLNTYRNQPDTISNKISEIFGDTNKEKYIKNLEDTLDPLASAMYEKSLKTSKFVRNPDGSMKAIEVPNKLPQQKFANLDKNPYIHDALNQALRVHKELRVSGPKGGIEPINSMRRLDYAKEILDNQISREIASPAPNKRLISSLTSAKNDLVNTMDSYSPSYKRGREYSAEKLSTISAQELADKINWGNTNTDEFISDIMNMTDRQRDGLRIGIRDWVSQGFGNKNNPAVFARSLLSENMHKKLIAAIGESDANNIIKFAKKLDSQDRFRNRIFGGSRTDKNISGLEDAGLAIEQFAGAPIRNTGRFLGRLIDKNITQNTQNKIAEILLSNPELLTLPVARPTATKINLPKVPRAAIAEILMGM